MGMKVAHIKWHPSCYHEQIKVAGKVYKPSTADVEKFMQADEVLEETGESFEARQLKIPYAPPRHYGSGNISKGTKIQKRKDAAMKMELAKASLDVGNVDGQDSPSKGGTKRQAPKGSRGAALTLDGPHGQKGKRKRTDGVSDTAHGSGRFTEGSGKEGKKCTPSRASDGGGSRKKARQ